MADINYLNLLLNILTVAIGGGGLVAVLTYRSKMRELDLKKDEQDGAADKINFDTILSEMRKQRDEAWAKVGDYEQRINQLEVEISGLRIARDLDPFPNWIVAANDFSYLYVNREFERCFLAPDGRSYRDVIGRKHEDVWPEAFCQLLYRLNAAAKARPDGTARAATTLVVPHIGKAQVTVHKFPVKAEPSGVIIGWAGFITSIEPEQEKVG